MDTGDLQEGAGDPAPAPSSSSAAASQAPLEPIVDDYPRVPIERLIEQYAAETNPRNTNILSSVLQYNKTKVEEIETLPVFNGQILDVAQLFVRITERGAYKADVHTQPEFWRSICQAINIDERHAAYIQQFYLKCLLPYETGLRLYKKKQAEKKQQEDHQAKAAGEEAPAGAGEAAAAGGGGAVDKLVIPQSLPPPLPLPTAPSSSSGAGGGGAADPAAAQDPVAAATAVGAAAAEAATAAAAKPVSRYMQTKQRKEQREREARLAQQQAQQHHMQQMGLSAGYPMDHTMGAPGGGAGPYFPPRPMPYPVPGAYGYPVPGAYGLPPQPIHYQPQSQQNHLYHHLHHHQAHLGNRMAPDVLATVVADLMSDEVPTVVRGLNMVLVRSSDYDPNTVLHLEGHPDLVNALGGLLEAVNPVGNVLFASSSVAPTAQLGSKRKHDADDARYVEALVTDKKDEAFTWDSPLPSSPFVRTLALTLNDNHVLHSAVLAVRNFSFEACNEAVIAASYLLMKHLVALVIASYGSLTPPEPSQHAFDTLANIATRLDLTGTKRLSHTRWLENVLMDPRTHPHGRAKVAMHQTLASKHDYLEVVKALAAYIFTSVRQTVDRVQTARGLELLTKLASNEANKPIFADVPTDMLEDLVSLLCVNLTETEPLAVAEATVTGLRQASILGYTQKHVRSTFMRIPACETTAFFDVLSDAELRDMALEAIHTLCTLCPDLLPHFARVPHFVTILLRICALRIPRGERYDSGPAKAAAIGVLLAQRATDRGVRGRFKAAYTEMVTGAAWSECVLDVFAAVAPMLDVVDDAAAPYPGASGDPLPP